MHEIIPAYFVVYSFLGWLIEGTYHLKAQKRLINRGFFQGPYCPIYGTSAVLMVLLLEPYRDNILLLFLGGFFIASAVELITGILLERIFEAKWWDYSKRAINIGGYVCVKFSIYWGFLTVLLIHIIHPPVEQLLHEAPLSILRPITLIVGVLFLTDAVYTLKSLVKFRKIFIDLSNISSEIKKNVTVIDTEKVQNHLLAKLKERNKDLRRLQETIKKEITLRQQKWLRNYPGLKSKRFNNIIQELKEKAKETINNKSNHSQGK